MGCFSTPKCEERRDAPQHSTGQRGLRDSRDLLLSNKPVELPDPRTLEGGRINGQVKPVAEVGAPRPRTGGRSAFSGPLVGAHAVEVESRAATLNYFSADDGRKPGLRPLRRATSFGGQPQPLPLPAVENTPPRARTMYLPAPEDAVTRPSTSQVRSFKLEDGAAGAWSSRRERERGRGALPLPSPSIATRLLPGLAAFEFREIQLATDDFAENYLLERTPLVYNASLKDPIDNWDVDMAVLRFPENAAQVCSQSAIVNNFVTTHSLVLQLNLIWLLDCLCV